MRHRVKKSNLGRQNDHLKALIRNLVTSLLLHEKIKTTRSKAKAIEGKVEKMITLARAVESGKKSKREAIRHFQTIVFDENASRKLLEVYGKRYANHASGFTRITNLGPRSGDAAPMVQIELIQAQ